MLFLKNRLKEKKADKQTTQRKNKQICIQQKAANRKTSKQDQGCVAKTVGQTYHTENGKQKAKQETFDFFRHCSTSLSGCPDLSMASWYHPVGHGFAIDFRKTTAYHKTVILLNTPK